MRLGRRGLGRLNVLPKALARNRRKTSELGLERAVDASQGCVQAAEVIVELVVGQQSALVKSHVRLGDDRQDGSDALEKPHQVHLRVELVRHRAIVSQRRAWTGRDWSKELEQRMAPFLAARAT